ncbi:MAG: class I tRNA ligase family protein, partial [Nitrospirota bacterium]
ADMMEKSGADIWFTMDAKELLPGGTTCPECGSKEFIKETDILDVWFDSGVSWDAVLNARPGVSWPADLYLEGSDQHRGWFQSSLLTSVGTTGEAPFRSVLTHGFTVDGAGKKMSKSKGNVIAPQKVIDTYGAEVLRLWVSASDYTEDVRISDEILKRLSEAYRRIRNTARYILGNLYDFDPAKDAMPLGGMMEIDRWALHRLQQLNKDVRQAYENSAFHMIYHSLHNFCAVDMSAFYLDVLKDRLYTSKPAGVERRSAQTAMFEILSGMTRLMAPVLSFTAEEVWSFLPGADKEESVHLALFPALHEEWTDPALAERWNAVLDVRSEVAKVLEKLRAERVIGHSLDARVEVYVEDNYYGFLNDYTQILEDIFIVSNVNLHRPSDPPLMEVLTPMGWAKRPIEIPMSGFYVSAAPAEGKKCERCWKIKKDVGRSEAHPTLCARCANVLEN